MTSFRHLEDVLPVLDLISIYYQRWNRKQNNQLFSQHHFNAILPTLCVHFYIIFGPINDKMACLLRIWYHQHRKWHVNVDVSWWAQILQWEAMTFTHRNLLRIYIAYVCEWMNNDNKIVLCDLECYLPYRCCLDII